MDRREVCQKIDQVLTIDLSAEFAVTRSDRHETAVTDDSQCSYREASAEFARGAEEVVIAVDGDPGRGRNGRG